MKVKEVLLNILKMWHSQTKVWKLMEKYEAIAVNDDSHKHQLEDQQPFYSRVAMFRLDVVYITPIDIYKVPKSQLLSKVLNQVGFQQMMSPITTFMMPRIATP